QLGTSSNSTTSGKVLVAGGINGSSSVATAQLYDATTGSWGPAPSMSPARHQASATLLASGKVLFAGGIQNSTVLKSAALYNPQTGIGAWSAVADMAVARTSHTAVRLATSNTTLNNKVLVAGGSSGSASLTSVQLFDGTSAWSTTVPQLATAR